MKLVLCSEGFHTPNTVQATVELCGKPQDQITVAVINEAFAVEEGDKRWVLDNLNSVASNFPAEMDIINILALPLKEVQARIESKDMIFMVGGNADFLMHVITKTGFDSLLPTLLESKVYVGSSAGSRVIGRKMSTPKYDKVFANRKTYGVTESLNLIDFAITPHINSIEFPERTSDVFLDATTGSTFPVYGLQDDSAIIIDGEEQTYTGAPPYANN